MDPQGGFQPPALNFVMWADRNPFLRFVLRSGQHPSMEQLPVGILPPPQLTHAMPFKASR